MKRAVLPMMHAAYLLAITSNPFRFGPWSTMADLSTGIVPLDFAANLALMVPYALALRGAGLSFVATVGIVALTSTTVEASQLFNARVTSPVDVAANVLGVALVAGWPRIVPPPSALAIMPAAWSVGMLAPRLSVAAAATMAALLVAAAALATERRIHPMTQLAWCSLACLPLGLHHSGVAAAVVAFGFAWGRWPPRWAGLSSARMLAGAAAISAMLLLADGAFDPAYRPVWRGHAAILLAALAMAPIAARLSR